MLLKPPTLRCLPSAFLPRPIIVKAFPYACVLTNIPEDFLLGRCLTLVRAHHSLACGGKSSSVAWHVNVYSASTQGHSPPLREALVLCCGTPSVAVSLKRDLTEGSSAHEIQFRIWLFQEESRRQRRRGTRISLTPQTQQY